MGESVMDDALVMTIRFVTGMIHSEMSKYSTNISVGLSCEGSAVILVFRYRYNRYCPILNVGDKINHIDEFFNCYFDHIHHEYVDGENILTFSFTMMSDADMWKKYLDSLDRMASREKTI
jgi:hypothetical protein